MQIKLLIKSMAVIIPVALILTSSAFGIDSGAAVCETDRKTYQQGDTVVATMTNRSGREMLIADREFVDAVIATVEMKQRDNTWQPIDLYAAANAVSFKTLKPGESHVYKWRTVGYNRADTMAAPGTYRIRFQRRITTAPFVVTKKAYTD